jgi:hypothetical protein
MQYSIGRVYRFTQVFRYYIAREGVYAASLPGAGAAIARCGMQVVSPPGMHATTIV